MCGDYPISVHRRFNFIRRIRSTCNHRVAKHRPLGETRFPYGLPDLDLRRCRKFYCRDRPNIRGDRRQRQKSSD
jgi:hypothetical protein